MTHVFTISEVIAWCLISASLAFFLGVVLSRPRR